ncbi:MAG: N-methyl-L-tryptophan oxidase [Pseudomonadota bacterium]
MSYDLIVLGTGGIGSAALFSAARRGLKCLGVDRFAPGHDRGSSHGESRLIRLAYFEHPQYVPLLRRSYELWDALDPSLLRRSGVFYFGREQGPILGGVRASAELHSLDVRLVDTAATHPQYRLPDASQALFEADAGWLPVEDCVLRHIEGAIAAGAEHRWGAAVSSFDTDGQRVSVAIGSDVVRARSLVIAGGPWAGQLLPDLGLPLTVMRKHLHWFRCEDERYRHGFFYELPHGYFYGFPASNGRIKVAEHSGGEATADPLGASRAPCPVDDERIDKFVAEYLPGVRSERLQHSTCFYTMTPDEHFIVDRHPHAENVAFAAGLSGHGFKFAPAIGEALVDLVTDRATATDLSFMSADRFGATASQARA